MRTCFTVCRHRCLQGLCANSWCPPGWPGCLGALCGSAVIINPMKGQEWRPAFLLVIMPQNKDWESNLQRVLQYSALTEAIILNFKKIYIFNLCGLNSGSNTSRLFGLAGSDLAPLSQLLTDCPGNTLFLVPPRCCSSGFWQAPSRPGVFPAVAMAASYNRGSEGLGIDRLEVGPEFLSPAHDLLIHLSSSEREHRVQDCTSLDDDRLQTRHTDVNLDLVTGSLGQTWDT